MHGFLGLDEEGRALDFPPGQGTLPSLRTGGQMGRRRGSVREVGRG